MLLKDYSEIIERLFWELKSKKKKLFLHFCLKKLMYVFALQRGEKADGTLLSCALFADHEKQRWRRNSLLSFNALPIARCYLKGRLSTSTPSH